MVSLFSSDFPLRFVWLEVRNFLSYKQAKIDFEDFTALVGPNASGKSNLVTAIKLLREIPEHGLSNAIARRGGFDQLRHRSEGRPYEPSLTIAFRIGGGDISRYELAFSSVKGKRYAIKRENAEVHWGGERYFFNSDGRTVTANPEDSDEVQETKLPPGQSALLGAGSFAGFVVNNVLQLMQTVETNPAKVRDFQQPSSVRDFEPDGSNAVSIYEALTSKERSRLVEMLSAVVPGIVRIDVEGLADRQTLRFAQQTPTGVREFTARQMSDGTIRAFCIFLAALQTQTPKMLVVEEPETAIHLGATRTLVELLKSRTPETQVVITTHSAEVVDFLPAESLRVVVSDGGSSAVHPVASHTVELLRSELTSAGELLRMNALDPER